MYKWLKPNFKKNKNFICYRLYKTNGFWKFWNCIFPRGENILLRAYLPSSTSRWVYEISNTPPSCHWRRGFRWGYYGPGQDVVGVPWSLYRTVTAVRNRHAAALPPSSAVASLPQQSFVDRRALQLFVAAVPPPSFRAFLHVVYY